MSWSSANALGLRGLIRQTDFLSEINATRPKLGGMNLEEKGMNAAKLEGWEELRDKIIAMAQDNEEPRGESDYINTDKQLTN